MTISKSITLCISCVSDQSKLTNVRKGKCENCGKECQVGDINISDVDADDVLGQGRR